MALHSPYYHLDLCTGSGMLGLAAGIALGGNLRTVAYVEREAFAAAALMARMEDAALDKAPVWDNLTTLTDPEPLEYLRRFHPLLLTGGFPCQPFSCAGKRAGFEDERNLWSDIARFIEATQPEVLFFENVPGLISTRTIHHRSDLCAIVDSYYDAAKNAPTAKDRWYILDSASRLYRRFLKDHGISALLFILCDLERMGYRSTAGLFSAEEVGASHRRERIFIFAELDSNGRTKSEELRRDGPRHSGCGCELADPEGPRSEGPEPEGRVWADGCAPEYGIPLFAPGPLDPRWGEILERCPDLAPAAESNVRRVADGMAPSLDADRLRLTGNGVVPLAAAYAFVALAASLQSDQITS